MLHSKFGTRKKPPGWLGQCVEFYDNVNIAKQAKWFPHMSIGKWFSIKFVPSLVWDLLAMTQYYALHQIMQITCQEISNVDSCQKISMVTTGAYQTLDIADTLLLIICQYSLSGKSCSWYLIRRLHQHLQHAVQASWTCLLHDLGLDCTTCGIEHVLLYFRNQGFSNFDVYFNLA